MVWGSRRFGAYLKGLRESRRLTLQDIERLTAQDPAPVTRSFLSRLERGQAQLSAAQMVGLARVYRVRVGLLADRFDMDRELESLQQEGADGWSLHVLFERARHAGQSGQVQRALLLYEQAELRSMRDPTAGPARRRARIGVARALAASGRHRLARATLEDVLGERLSDEARAWALYFYARTSLALGQPVLARAAHLCLKEVAHPWPIEIETAAPVLEGEHFYFEGRLDQALEAFLGALDAARRGCDRSLESLCLCRLAEIGRRRGQLAEALEWVGRARDLAQTHGAAQMVVQADAEEGRIQAARRRFSLAREAWSRGRELARKFEFSQELFEIYFELWRLAVREGDPGEARAALRSLRHLAWRLETIPPEADELLDHWRKPPQYDPRPRVFRAGAAQADDWTRPGSHP